MSNESPPLVPQARPVYLDLRGRPTEEPPDQRDSHEEVKWHNPTTRVVVANIFIGTPAWGKPPRNFREKTGQDRYVWQPGETKSLPAEFTPGIQRTRCLDPECLPHPLDCLDPDHEKEIIGGEAPMLVNLGLQKRPKLNPALDDVLARQQEADRKEWEAYKRRQEAEIAAAKARAEQEVIQKDLEARARAEADATAAAVKHQSQTKNK